MNVRLAGMATPTSRECASYNWLRYVCVLAARATWDEKLCRRRKNMASEKRTLFLSPMVPLYYLEKYSNCRPKRRLLRRANFVRSTQATSLRHLLRRSKSFKPWKKDVEKIKISKCKIIWCTERTIIGHQSYFSDLHWMTRTCSS